MDNRAGQLGANSQCAVDVLESVTGDVGAAIWMGPAASRRRGPNLVSPPRSKLDPYAPLPSSSDVQSLSK